MYTSIVSGTIKPSKNNSPITEILNKIQSIFADILDDAQNQTLGYNIVYNNIELNYVIEGSHDENDLKNLLEKIPKDFETGSFIIEMNEDKEGSYNIMYDNTKKEWVIKYPDDILQLIPVMPSDTKKYSVSVDNKETEHKIGDSIWYIMHDENPFELNVHEQNDFVQHIIVSKNGIVYTNADNEPIYQKYGEFWTKQEAEKFLKNMPKDIPFKPEQPVYFVDNLTKTIIMGYTKEVFITDGKIVMKVSYCDGNSIEININEIKDKLFTCYEDANTALRKIIN